MNTKKRGPEVPSQNDLMVLLEGAGRNHLRPLSHKPFPVAQLRDNGPTMTAILVPDSDVAIAILVFFTGVGLRRCTTACPTCSGSPPRSRSVLTR